MAPLTSIRTSEGKLEIVNQLILPHTVEFIEIKTIDDAYEAIKSMKAGIFTLQRIHALTSSLHPQIRGAPAIASLAALSVADYLTRALESVPEPAWFASAGAFSEHVEAILAHLFTARPTAVNLGAATRRLSKALSASADAGKDVRAIAAELVAEAREIDAEDVGRNKQMSKWGGDWLVERVRAAGVGGGDELNVMTVCNTGSLATSVSSLVECKS